MKIPNKSTTQHFLSLKKFGFTLNQQNLTFLNKTQERFIFETLIISFFYKNKNLKDTLIRIEKIKKPSARTDGLKRTQLYRIYL